MSGLVPLDFDLMDWHQLLRLRRDPPRAHPVTVTVTVTSGEMQCVSAKLIPKKGTRRDWDEGEVGCSQHPGPGCWRWGLFDEKFRVEELKWLRWGGMLVVVSTDFFSVGWEPLPFSQGSSLALASCHPCIRPLYPCHCRAITLS